MYAHVPDGAFLHAPPSSQTRAAAAAEAAAAAAPVVAAAATPVLLHFVFFISLNFGLYCSCCKYLQSPCPLNAVVAAAAVAAAFSSCFGLYLF